METKEFIEFKNSEMWWMVEKKVLGETDEPVLKHNLCPLRTSGQERKQWSREGRREEFKSYNVLVSQFLVM